MESAYSVADVQVGRRYSLTTVAKVGIALFATAWLVTRNVQQAAIIAVAHLIFHQLF
jgi:hypothetical protein